MGFDVVLEDYFSSPDMYEHLAGGQSIDLAFEAWSASNPLPSTNCANVLNWQHAPPGKINAYPCRISFAEQGVSRRVLARLEDAHRRPSTQHGYDPPGRPPERARSSPF